MGAHDDLEIVCHTKSAAAVGAHDIVRLSHPVALAGALADLDERRMAAGDLAAAAPLGLAAFAFCFAVVLYRQRGQG